MIKHTNIQKIPNTVLVFMLLAPVVSIFYGMYVFNLSNVGNQYLYILQVFADTIAIFTVMSLWLTILLDILQSDQIKNDIQYDSLWIEKEKPSVDVLIPVANEPIEIIENTLKRAIEMHYSHKVYLLDDGESDLIEKLANNYKVLYIKRPLHRKGYAKSGNINYALETCKGEMFCIFDADHAPKETFITEILPFFKNKNVALVQTPQSYINTENFIASGTSQAQEIFYRYVQPAKNSFNAAFCVGTNVIYRRSAIDEINGIYMTNHSEDILTSIQLHKKGYLSIYYNKVLALGRAPETIDAFFRQQNRWARGGFFLFFHDNPLLSSNLTIDQRIQYAFSNMHYFSGFSIFLYLTFPLLYLLFGITSMKLGNSGSWFIHYAPFFVTVYFLPLFLLGKLKLSTISTAIASFSPYIHAFFSVIVKNNYHWISTESNTREKTPLMKLLWPHIFFITMTFFAVLIGWYKVADVRTTLFMTFWALLNSFFLFSFIRNGIITK